LAPFWDELRPKRSVLAAQSSLQRKFSAQLHQNCSPISGGHLPAVLSSLCQSGRRKHARLVVPVEHPGTMQYRGAIWQFCGCTGAYGEDTIPQSRMPLMERSMPTAMTRPLKIGLFLSVAERVSGSRWTLSATARHAEAAGFDSLWVADMVRRRDIATSSKQ
jgi:hypothetical protein